MPAISGRAAVWTEIMAVSHVLGIIALQDGIA
jgi:hypothetical protein